VCSEAQGVDLSGELSQAKILIIEWTCIESTL